MPCRCAGVKQDKCTCKILTSECPFLKPESAFVGRHQNHDAFKFSKMSSTKKKTQRTVTSVIKNMYESCAAYNLRYCPLRLINESNSMKLACKDIGLLVCFFLTNFVVFSAILLRMTANFSRAFFRIFRFVTRFLSTKFCGEIDESRPPPLPTPIQT